MVEKRSFCLKTTELHKVLAKVAKPLPQTVAELIDKNNNDHPTWMKYLLSSQLDMDRMDYLRRDSLFTGAGYGHFDWHRILSTFELYEQDSGRDIIWNEKPSLPSRSYLCSLLHVPKSLSAQTIRGFEKMIEAMWRRARSCIVMREVSIVPAIRRFWLIRAKVRITCESRSLPSSSKFRIGTEKLQSLWRTSPARFLARNW